MIELGLARIGRLLAAQKPLPWRAIHVAGTNGKGSVCTAISKMLHRADVKHGRFTSPHLIHRWDCISLNGRTVAEQLFRKVEDGVKRRNDEQAIRATNFELLTATAFEIFSQAKVEVGVVETGLGGRLDATNIIENPLVTVISKIGLDHQEFLGDTIEKIAQEKAGILKPGSPCVVDGSNTPSVLDVIHQHAQSISAGPVEIVDKLNQNAIPDPSTLPLQPHQIANLSCAQRATSLALSRLNRPLTSPSEEARVLDVRDCNMPGRLEYHSISHIRFHGHVTRRDPILIDGAHNPDSCAALANFLEPHRSSSNRGITWILAFSATKDIRPMLRILLRPGDTVMATKFPGVKGMPWVKPLRARDIVELVHELGLEKVTAKPVIGHKPMKALAMATGNASTESGSIKGEGMIVVAGSLYLVSVMLKLIQKKRSKLLRREKSESAEGRRTETRDGGEEDGDGREEEDGDGRERKI